MLSVPTPEPQLPPEEDTMTQDNAMDAPTGGGSFDSNTDTVPQQGETQEDFEADFDAGVEANEEEDPKKYIQQLTGKLSQSLRKYNEGLPQPDAELSKYVAGMIIKQAVDGLSQEDVADIMDKVEDDGAEEDMEQAAQQQQPEPQPTDTEQPPMEPMNETTGSTVDATDTVPQKKTSKIRKGGYSRKPYIASV